MPDVEPTTRPRCYKKIMSFQLLIKSKIPKNKYIFLALKHLYVVILCYYIIITVKKPIISVGILTFMSMIQFMLS